MKRLLIVATTLLAALFLTSCNKEQEISEIVGTWTVTTAELTFQGQTISLNAAEAGIEAELTFNEDGTGTAKTTAFTEDFTYEYVDGVITWISNGVTEIIPVTINDKTMVISVDNFVMDEMECSAKIHLVKK